MRVWTIGEMARDPGVDLLRRLRSNEQKVSCENIGQVRLALKAYPLAKSYLMGPVAATAWGPIVVGRTAGRERFGDQAVINQQKIHGPQCYMLTDWKVFFPSMKSNVPYIKRDSAILSPLVQDFANKSHSG